MRTIKFRGITVDAPHSWVYGDLSIEYEGTHRIGWWVSTLIEPENNFWEPIHHCAEVIPETVGQYTGVNDKNGKEIWEGDILIDKNQFREINYKVFSVSGGFAVNIHNDDFYKKNVIFYESIAGMQMSTYINESTESISTIHDHLLTPQNIMYLLPQSIEYIYSCIISTRPAVWVALALFALIAYGAGRVAKVK